ncbi:hypothetical protein ACQY0O_004279 [Thecaphora frezii]
MPLPPPSHSILPQSPDPTLPDPRWLQGLESHPIFTPRPSQPDHFSRYRRDNDASAPATNPRLMAVRNTDLVLVVDNTIRIASLLDAKASLSARPMSPSPSSSSPHLAYKTLDPTDPSHLRFDIRHILVNPTGKLLAVVGEHTVSILVMPRSGYTKQVGAHISSRSVPVGPYYHSVHSFSRIAKVQWHPWGEAGTSLLVLTDDGLLREYDVARDTEEPQQTASFLPHTQAAAGNQLRAHAHARARARSRSATPTAAALAASIYSTSPAHTQSGYEPAASPSRARATTPGAASAFGLTADDDDSEVAVSFALCISEAPARAPTMFDEADDEALAATEKTSQRVNDWSPFTVFGLMKNGDIWAICPFMPRNSMIPPSYIHSVSRLTSLKLTDAAGDAEGTEAEMQLRFLNALLKQVADKCKHARARSSAMPGPDRLGRQRSTSTMDLDRLSEAPVGLDAVANAHDAIGSEANHDVPLRLHPPSWAYAEDFASSGGKNAPRPQGPFLLRPAPLELCDERESAACDIAWTWLDRRGRSGDASSDAGPVSGLGIVTIVGHDGRVDVGVLLDPIEPRWGRAQMRARKPAKSAKPARTNRYGLSDTEDEGDESVVLDLDGLTLNEPLPMMVMYETIDLGLLDSVMEASRSTQSESSDLLLTQSACFRPCLVADPLYRDTLYVYHPLGAQCLGFAKWAGKLMDALNLPAEEELEAASDGAVVGREKALARLLHHGEASEVVWIVKTVAPSEGGEREAPLTNPVTAVCIVSDVYLSYSLLAVTRDLQLVALELSLRIDAGAGTARYSIDAAGEGEAGLGDAATSNSGGRRAYVSLLGDGPPFTPPALFNTSGTLHGLPSQPRRAAAVGSGASLLAGEIKVTPETLRQLGKTVETLRHEIRDVVSAGNAVQARLDLQLREMTRMLEKLEAIRQRSRHVGEGGDKGLEERTKRVVEKQRELTSRTDKALQRLMDRHQPSLSVYEKRWFDELARIAVEVGGSSSSSKAGGGKKGLVARCELLQHHLDLLRPALVQSKNRNASSSAEGGVGVGMGAAKRALGSHQLKTLQTLLANEHRLLQEAKERIHHINAAVARAAVRQ